MHLLRTESRSLDEAEVAIDLAQTPADLVFLSFSDSDLSSLAGVAQRRGLSIRLANLSDLKHPYSVDLYVEKVIAKSRFVLVRLLGGLDYWRYGVEELCRTARNNGVKLAIVSGDAAADPRLSDASTIAQADLDEIFARLQSGGSANIATVLDWVEATLRGPAPWTSQGIEPPAGLYDPARRRAGKDAPRAKIIFYRSYLLAGDNGPILALADALHLRGFDVEAIFVSSLKDPQAADFLRARFEEERPDVILNATAFSARLDDGGSVLDEADAPVLQIIFSSATEAQWADDPRGLRAADLAMNVVLPEMDGRLITRAIAVKAETAHRADLEFTPLTHVALPSRVDFVSDLAAAWAKLRRTPRFERSIACILSDYPGKAGRGGYAVGLDTAKSVGAIARALDQSGYDIGALPTDDELMRLLETQAFTVCYPLPDYQQALAAAPRAFSEQVFAQWGDPAGEADGDGMFRFSVISANRFFVALQPGRGAAAEHKANYHDVTLAPRHAYIAFYMWLRRVAKIDALIHCGAHGTLEWLPGKANAPGPSCAPEAVLGPTPVIYPFIVNNPGEAAQAKRRIAALTIGHLTPPLMSAGRFGAAQDIEALLDEYASAEALDPKRAKLIAKAILARARETGLAQDCGIKDDENHLDALARLDAFLCDVKDLRIGDGLHVFGTAPDPGRREALVAALPHEARAGAGELIARCGEAELAALIAALDGRFVAPGPGGAPSRGRIDVLPTGRNIYSVDPRSVPTRTAFEIGKRAAEEVLRRHAQDNGDWPKRIVMDIWASATMRTGGDDLAQAMALIGAAPVWDHATSRISGFEVVPLAKLGRPRVDVTLRISGMFRDAFPAQIALYDQAVRAISERDEDDDDNPLSASARESGEAPLRIFGAAPGAFGLQLSRAIDNDASVTREELGRLYIKATSHAYRGAQGEATQTSAFAGRVASADAMIHVQDQVEQDLLESDAIVDHEGGFSAAAEMLGGRPAIYHVATSDAQKITVRTMPEEIARIMRGRAGNPRWIRGQMQHGHRGAAEIAETVDHLFGLAIMTDATQSHHFDLMFDATCGDPEVAAFLASANPRAAGAILSRFEEAARRGFWRSRRNSAHEDIRSMRERLSC
ncbi:cobaltochelatase subunit CobN [Methylocella silvestris]|uniref:Cobaltochelatase subunit CobN n=1 Tax=Methylocella silvestris TaxID=199596 RepID=A0A2J7TL37_METSI|nr:cobaltochelatase subunit CobN [Methylocella silvestris]PNG27486.1 cobaltochelatase subunit CobN [Methylocella silvestris]